MMRPTQADEKRLGLIVVDSLREGGPQADAVIHDQPAQALADFAHPAIRGDWASSIDRTQPAPPSTGSNSTPS